MVTSSTNLDTHCLVVTDAKDRLLILIDENLNEEHTARLPLKDEIDPKILSQSELTPIGIDLLVVNTHQEIDAWDLFPEFAQSDDYGFLSFKDKSEFFSSYRPEHSENKTVYKYWDILNEADKKLVEKYIVTTTSIIVSLKQKIQELYDFSNPDVAVMGGDNLRNVYLVTQGEEKYVLRWFPKERTKETIIRDTSILEFLAEKNFPAPRIVRTRKGDYIVNINDRHAILTTYIEGDIVSNTPDSLFKMGVLMARLHSLDTATYWQEADWSVEKETKVIEKYVANMDISKIEHAEVIPDVLRTLKKLPSFDNLPKSIIHSDIHRRNTIKTPAGEYYFIDWDDAGIGTTILDLAEVLSQVCIRFEDEENYRGVFLNKDLADSFMKGYYSIRTLNSAEKRSLIDAMKFTALAYVVQYWNSEISLGDWQRYQLEEKEGQRLIEDFI